MSEREGRRRGARGGLEGGGVGGWGRTPNMTTQMAKGLGGDQKMTEK